MRSVCKHTTLGDVCEVLNGLWIGKKEPFINIAVIRNTNFSKDCRLNLSDVAYIDAEVKQFEKRRLQYGDIIIEKSGGSEKQPVGRAVLFDVPNGDYSFSNFTAALRIKDGVEVSPRFLHRCLCSHYFRGETFKMQSKTTGLHNLDMKAYLKLPIPCLSIAEQERIVSELDLLTGIIDKQKQQLKELDNLAQSVFYDMFGSKEFDSETLDSIYDFIDYRGATPNKIDNGVPLITAKNVRKGYIDYSIKEFISEEEYSQRQSRGISHQGDILFTTEAPMGYAAIADLERFSAGQRLITLQLNNRNQSRVNNIFVLHYILSDSFQQELLGLSTGCTVKGIKASKLKLCKVSIPPLELQESFAKKIQAIEFQKESINRSIAESQKLFDYTMDKYFG